MLTDPKVRQAKPKAKAYKLSDEQGLYIQISPKGKKTWYLKYRFGGKEKKLNIGSYPEISLKEARNRRAKAKEHLANGLDPVEVKKREELKKKLQGDTSLVGVAQQFLDLQAKTLAPTTIKRKRELLKNEIVPSLGIRPVHEVETYELVACLKAIDQRGHNETAQKTRQLLNQIFRYAKQNAYIKHNPASDLIGAISPSNPKHMAAIVDPQPFGKLLVDLDNYTGTPIVNTLLRLLPLVFQRPGEVCKMEWAEVDLDKGVWEISYKKIKGRKPIEGDHIVPLSRQAVELLKNLHCITGRFPFVFCKQRDYNSPTGTETISSAFKGMGYNTSEEHTAHGFRASARTMLAEQLNTPAELIELQLGHKVSDPLGNAYNRTKYLSKRIQMMQIWADYCDELKKQHLAGNVVTANFK